MQKLQYAAQHTLYLNCMTHVKINCVNEFSFPICTISLALPILHLLHSTKQMHYVLSTLTTTLRLSISKNIEICIRCVLHNWSIRSVSRWVSHWMVEVRAFEWGSQSHSWWVLVPLAVASLLTVKDRIWMAHRLLPEYRIVCKWVYWRSIVVVPGRFNNAKRQSGNPSECRHLQKLFSNLLNEQICAVAAAPAFENCRSLLIV